MPRMQPFLGFLRPALAPRCTPNRPASSFSTVSRFRADEPVNATFTAKTTPIASTSTPEISQTPPTEAAKSPSSPEDASRAADLAAAEAATEADNAQSSAPKPILPSDHTSTTSSEPSHISVVQKEFTSRIPNSRSKTHGIREVPKQTPNAQVLPIGRAKKMKLEAQAAKAFKAAKALKEQVAANTGISTAASAIETATQLPPAKYHVARSRGQNIPVYSDYKRGGNLHQTTVRKITGDLQALRNELKLHLDVPDKDVKVNVLTNHVVVKGHHVPEVVEFLKARGM